MKHVILYATLLIAFTIDHFYQLGRIDEARSNAERTEQDLTEAYKVADILAKKYETQVDKNEALNCRVTILAKANRMMLDRLNTSDIHAVMKATLPPLERVK